MAFHLDCFIFKFLFYFNFQTVKFMAWLLILSFSFLVARQPQELVITMYSSIQEVDLASYDILFNSITTTSQLCRQRDGKPWRGAKEKCEVLIKLFVHDLSLVGSIVANMIASIGIVFYDIQLLIFKILKLYLSIYFS